MHGHPKHLLEPNRSFSSHPPYLSAHQFTIQQLLCHGRVHVQASFCFTGKAHGHQRGFPSAHHPVLSTMVPRVVPRPPLLCEGLWLKAWQGRCMGRSRDRTWMQPGDGSNGIRGKCVSRPHLQLLLAALHGEDSQWGSTGSNWR